MMAWSSENSYNDMLRDTSSNVSSLIFQESLVVLLEVQSVLESLYRQATIMERSKIFTAITRVRNQTKRIHRLAITLDKEEMV